MKISQDHGHGTLFNCKFSILQSQMNLKFWYNKEPPEADTL